MERRRGKEKLNLACAARHRIIFARFVLLLVFFFEGISLVRLQAILPRRMLSSDGSALPKGMRREVIVAKRGTIYARDMTPLAMTVIRYYVCADPTLVEERERAALTLSTILNEPYEDIFKSLLPGDGRSKPLRFRLIKRDVDAQVAERLLKALRAARCGRELKGIFIGREAKRVYPCGRLASQLIGFVNVDGTVKEGIEMKWDDVLSGRDGIKFVEVNAAGEPIAGGEVELVEPSNGKDLVLTIDPTIQRDVEEVLREAIKRHRARAATAAVMDVQTGEVLAAVSMPDFDPNRYSEAQQESFRNRVTMFVYEPGSAFKVLVAAIGIDCGAFDERSTAYCDGKWEVGNSAIRCWVASGHGNQTLADAIKNSCNVAMAKFAMRIPRDKFWRYLLKFGFGKFTGCGAPETAGWIDPPEVWSKVRRANLGYGYGIMVTPLQLLRAISAIANGGLLLKPTLVRAIVDQDGHWQSLTDGVNGEYVIAPTTAAKVRRMMELVVLKGTGRKARLDGYTCAGKTGTTRKMIPGKAYGSDVICTFVGFFPAESPKVAAIIVLDEPKKSKWASETAAPLFSEVMSKVALRLGIPPSDGRLSGRTARAIVSCGVMGGAKSGQLNELIAFGMAEGDF
ncbi:MAG: hypothetical protein GDYSWBUE_001529 [Candidatus Fervidibacterota bacterium]